MLGHFLLHPTLCPEIEKPLDPHGSLTSRTLDVHKLHIWHIWHIVHISHTSHIRHKLRRDRFHVYNQPYCHEDHILFHSGTIQMLTNPSIYIWRHLPRKRPHAPSSYKLHFHAPWKCT